MSQPKDVYSGRFVVLRHEVGQTNSRDAQGGAIGMQGDNSFPEIADHWDLMLESDAGTLWTWRLAESLLLQNSSEENPASTIRAERIQDHRVEYLDYEGPLSGNRGYVTRELAGEYRLWVADFPAPVDELSLEVAQALWIIDEPLADQGRFLESRMFDVDSIDDRTLAVVVRLMDQRAQSNILLFMSIRGYGTAIVYKRFEKGGTK